MRWFAFITILLLATLLEAGSLLHVFTIPGWYISPKILITLLVYYALVCSYEDTIVTSFFIGFAADLAGGVMGPHMLCYGLFGVILNQTGQMLLIKRAIYKAFIVFLSFLITESLACWLSSLKLEETREHVISIIFLTSLYSAIICPLVWSGLSALSGWTNLQKSRSDWAHH